MNEVFFTSANPPKKEETLESESLYLIDNQSACMRLLVNSVNMKEALVINFLFLSYPEKMGNNGLFVN